MPELIRNAEPIPPGAFFALMSGKLGVPRIRSGEELALLTETGARLVEETILQFEYGMTA